MSWWEHAYPGGPMVGPPLRRPLYPPDSAPERQPSSDGQDVVAIKRAISRGGRWPWGTFDRAYSNSFSHGKSGGNVGDSGIAGFQRQQKIEPTGNLGEKTYNAIRSARIPDGLPNAGEPLLDATAIQMLEDYAADDAGGPATRCRLSEHFIVEEFDCNDGTKVPSAYYESLKYLCRTFLEPLHAAYGPVTVNSGYRTPSYNAGVGGASNSFHIYTAHDANDPAADVACGRGTPSQWHAKLDAIRQAKGGNGGLGRYSSFVHIDLRDYPSDWSG